MIKSFPAFAAISALLLTGCATEQPYHPPASASRYQEMLDGWKNKDINDLIYAWGPPASTFTMPNKNRMFTWDGVKVGPAAASAAASAASDCRTTAVTNPADTIVLWTLKGGGCVLGYSDEELQRNLDMARILALSLEKGKYIRITFYGDAVNEFGKTVSVSTDGYFIGYNKTDGTVSIQDRKRSSSKDDSETFRLSAMRQMVLLQDPDKGAK